MRSGGSTEWRSLDWLPNYEVSEDGRVRRNGNEIYQFTNKSGHIQCCPWVDGRQLKCWIHRLVCEAFHGPPSNERREVAHWDGDPSNNHYANLRWATHKENHADRRRHGTTNAGENHPAAKLTEDDVRLIRSSPIGRQELAKKLGVSPRHITAIRRRVTWKEVV